VLTLIHTPEFVQHQTPPGHPERPERARIMEMVADEWRLDGGEVVAPRSASDVQLSRVHDDDYLRRVAATSGRSTALDPDTFTSPESVRVAHLAAGAAIEAVERVMGGRQQRALALVRPPGHHAERNRAMGFCLYNNAAVAAAHARSLGAHRVAIVDYDVHHGNGTQHIFEADPTVLYVSLHQYPFYPGTGAAKETGVGDGLGFTVNVPLEVGAFDEDYHLVFTKVVDPVLRAFKPELVIVSAGFDAHERDPLAGMRLSSEAFGAMTHDLRAVADDCCGGRLLALAEGGYDLKALRDSLQAVVSVLGPAERPAVKWAEPGDEDARRGRAGVELARSVLSAHWPI
jgi:acetoin utilization deacetylase AcuC-like enzyme